MRNVGGLILAVLAAAAPAAESIWWVSPQGRDEDPGTKAQPFATPARALAALRTKPAGQKAIVIMTAGTWYLDEPLTFTAVEGGTAAAPVIWRSATPGVARLVGGRRVDGKVLSPVTDPAVLERLPEAARGKVLGVDLERLGLPPVPAPTKAFAGTGALPALYEGDDLLPVARWPNEGFVTIEQVLDSGLEPKPHGGAFRAREDRLAAWTRAAPAEGWWMEGYWRVPWALDGVPVASIAPAERTITLAAPVGSGIGSKYSPLKDGTRQGDGKERYRVRNLIEELDEPGEWVLTSTPARLLVWPRGGSDARLTLVSGKSATVEVRDAAYLRLQGLAIAGGMAGAVRIQGGEEVALEGCRIRATPGVGIEVRGGRNHLVQSCEVAEVGAAAISDEGGNRETLTSGGHRLINNHLHHVGQIRRVVSAIDLRGVGAVVANNLIHDSPYGGITFGGNDHRIERNEIHNIGLEGGDLGGIYTGADWTSWGNLIRHNLIHHSRTANGVYLDDGDSGDEVVGNVFYRLACGPFIGGGSHNRIHGNVVLDCKVGIHLDDRGVGRRYGAADSGQRRKAEQLKITEALWSERYPELKAWYTTEDLGLPTGNLLENNVLARCGKGVDNRSSKPNKPRFVVNNTKEVADNPGYKAPEQLDFTRLPGVDLPDIPMATIGLQRDGWRPKLPTDAETGRLTPRKAALDFDSNTDVEATNKAAGGK